MKLLTGLFLLSLVPLAQAQAQTAQSIEGTWHGTAIAHHIPVPLTLRLSGSGTNLKAALLNGPDEAAASSAVLKGDHLAISFSDYAKTFDLTLAGSGADAKLTGSFGNQTIRYPITLLAPGTPIPPSHPGPAAVDGDWEIAVPNIRGEKAWKLRIEHLNPSLARAVIQRIDGDTGSIYATDPSSGIYSHFSAYGPLIFSIAPQPDGSLIVSNMMSADLKPPELQNLIAHRPADARKLALTPPTDIAQQTTVKDPNIPFAFSFPDLNGKLVSNTDARFDGKVVLIAIGGSWCPNCHDEAPMLEDLYKRFHDRGLEVVSLSFEEEEQMKNPTGLRAFVARYGLTFPVLLAGNTDQLNEKIPQGVNLNCWPTSFFLGRDGRVKEVHAGFSGPANPEAHAALVREVTELVEHLLAEPTPARSAKN